MSAPDTVACSRCGRQSDRRKALGINDAWLCGDCLKEGNALDTFLKAQLQLAVGRAVCNGLGVVWRWERWGR